MSNIYKLENRMSAVYLFMGHSLITHLSQQDGKLTCCVWKNWTGSGNGISDRNI